MRDDRDIWQVLDPVEVALRPGLIVVNHGTGDPGENREVAEHWPGSEPPLSYFEITRGRRVSHVVKLSSSPTTPFSAMSA